jgi:sirohydrochlorin ferrochelatase
VSERAIPFYCPYCGEEDLEPQGAADGEWHCRSCTRSFSYGAPLGPHPLLLDALGRCLAQADPAGARDQTAVVLAAVGSSDPDANTTIARLAARWQTRAGWLAVRPAYASMAPPDPAAAVTGLLQDGARRVLVATYLLAPGCFADRIRVSSLAAGAAAVSPALGASAEVADVLLDRYADARSSRRTAAQMGLRAQARNRFRR